MLRRTGAPGLRCAGEGPGPGQPGVEDQLPTQAEALKEPHQDRACTRFRNIGGTDLSGDGELQSEVESCLVIRRRQAVGPEKVFTAVSTWERPFYFPIQQEATFAFLSFVFLYQDPIFNR